MFGLIVVPLDGSKAAEEALGVATFLARKDGAHIHLVRACAAPSVIDYSAEGILRDALRTEEWTTCEKCLEKAVAPLRDEGFQVETAVLDEGNAAEQVLKYADEQKAGLIVLTSHGRTGIGRFLLGSVAENIARHANCPVMIVGREALHQAHETTP